jgi:D-glutamate cyclase-like, C-terminal
MSETQLSIDIENLLVARNLRQMRVAQAALTPGYYLRAARHLRKAEGCILIGTGFPVADTFETDGPVGAIALYEALSALGAEPVLACAPPLSSALERDFRVLTLTARDLDSAREDARRALAEWQPSAIISIERPGLTADGRYYNMRGEDISARCGIFDPFLEYAQCPTIAIGDGGNEIGMGNIAGAISALDIRVSVTGCSELLVADVSNWGAYGLIAFLGLWAGKDLLGKVSPTAILDYLSVRGSVDGVTRENTLTEDGLEATEGCQVIEQLRQLTGFANSGQ